MPTIKVITPLGPRDIELTKFDEANAFTVKKYGKPLKLPAESAAALFNARNPQHADEAETQQSEGAVDMAKNAGREVMGAVDMAKNAPSIVHGLGSQLTDDLRIMDTEPVEGFGRALQDVTTPVSAMASDVWNLIKNPLATAHDRPLATALLVGPPAIGAASRYGKAIAAIDRMVPSGVGLGRGATPTPLLQRVGSAAGKMADAMPNAGIGVGMLTAPQLGIPAAIGKTALRLAERRWAPVAPAAASTAVPAYDAAASSARILKGMRASTPPSLEDFVPGNVDVGTGPSITPADSAARAAATKLAVLDALRAPEELAVAPSAPPDLAAYEEAIARAGPARANTIDPTARTPGSRLKPQRDVPKLTGKVTPAMKLAALDDVEQESALGPPSTPSPVPNPLDALGSRPRARDIPQRPVMDTAPTLRRADVARPEGPPLVRPAPGVEDRLSKALTQWTREMDAQPEPEWLKRQHVAASATPVHLPKTDPALGLTVRDFSVAHSLINSHPKTLAALEAIRAAPKTPLEALEGLQGATPEPRALPPSTTTPVPPAGPEEIVVQRWMQGERDPKALAKGTGLKLPAIKVITGNLAAGRPLPKRVR